MRTFGLIGYPLGHSFSKKLFEEKFREENIADSSFDVYELPHLGNFKNLIVENSDLRGLSVTIPYKEQVINHIDEIEPVAKEIGSVNCIKIYRTRGKVMMKGFNTDIYGFEESIKPLLRKNHRKALILGTGGSSKSVAYVLDKLGLQYLFISRQPIGCKQIRYEIINDKLMKEHTVIINATPVGIFPNTENAPEIPYSSISGDHLLFDLNYNPETTLFLKKGKERGAMVKNGLEMLRLQAEKAWEIWNEDVS